MTLLMLLRNWFGRRRPASRPLAWRRRVLPRQPYRPVLELLEDRLPPGTLLSVGPLGVGNVLGSPLVSPLPPSGSSSTPTMSATSTTTSTPSSTTTTTTATPLPSVTSQPTTTGATPATITASAPPATTTPTDATLTTSMGAELPTTVSTPTSSTNTGGGAAPTPPAVAPVPGSSGSTTAGSTASAPQSSAPSISITGVSPDSGASSTDRITNATTLAIIGTATAGATVGVSVGNQFAMTQAAADGTFSATLPGPLPEGTFTIMAGVMGSGGQTAMAQSSVTIDRTPPRVLLQAPTYTVNTTPTVTVTAQDTDGHGLSNAVSVDVDLKHDGSFTDPGDQNFGTGTLNAAGVAQVTLGTLTPGTYAIQARVSDLAGNVGVSDTATMQVSGNPLANIPLGFAPNLGQSDPVVQYETLGNGYGIFLTGQGAVLSLTSPMPTTPPPGTTTPAGATTPPNTTSPAGAPTPPPGTTAPTGVTTPPAGTNLGGTLTETLTLGLGGANMMAQAQPIAVDQLGGTANYFIGNDPSKWVSNAPTYSEVHYQDVYSGIDETFQGQQGSLEYTFLVHPGANPGQIVLNLQGTQGVSVDANGNLVLAMMGGTVTQSAPDIYQETASGKQEVGGRYVLLGPNQVGFQVNAYDATKALIIDPTLKFSTYVGGSANGSSNGNGIAVDSSGVYVVGDSDSTDFPTTSGVDQTKNNGGRDVVVFKLNLSGTALIYSTYLGGSKDDTGRALAVDASGNVYVTGDTQSTNFPTTTGVVQTSNNTSTTVFVAKLNNAGSGLDYSTYFGGSNGTDTGRGIAIDGSGDAFVTGDTNSTDFPTTTGVAQTVNNGGHDAFVFELNSGATGKNFSTYLGGAKDDVARGIVLQGGNLFITGDSVSTDAKFPTTTGAFQTKNNGGDDGFVIKLKGDGTSVLYGTYLGGSGDDQLNGIAVDGSGDAFVVGTTHSDDLATTTGAIQTARKGFNDAYVAELNTTGTGLGYLTYLGGDFDDEGNAITLDGLGNAYVTGAANTGFPLKNPLPSGGNQNIGSNQDFFVSVIKPGGTALQFSTYLGGFAVDSAHAIDIDSAGDVFVAGQVHSSDFPTTTGAFQTVRGTNPTIAVARIDAANIFPPPPPPPPPPPGGGGGGGGGVGALFPEDTFEPNDTSDQATQFGTLTGSQTHNNLTITRHDNGLFDYDWYRWSMATAGTFTASIKVTSGGDLELHLFTLSGNTLVELGHTTQTSAGQTLSLSATVAAGQAILVEVKGLNSSRGVQDQGTYNLTVTLA